MYPMKAAFRHPSRFSIADSKFFFYCRRYSTVNNPQIIPKSSAPLRRLLDEMGPVFMLNWVTDWLRMLTKIETEIDFHSWTQRATRWWTSRWISEFNLRRHSSNFFSFDIFIQDVARRLPDFLRNEGAKAAVKKAQNFKTRKSNGMSSKAPPAQSSLKNRKAAFGTRLCFCFGKLFEEEESRLRMPRDFKQA